MNEPEKVDSFFIEEPQKRNHRNQALSLLKYLLAITLRFQNPKNMSPQMPHTEKKLTKHTLIAEKY